MVRSFHYSAYGVLIQSSSFRAEDIPVLDPWADLWYHSMSAIFLHSYLDVAGKSPFIPNEREELEILFHALLMEKAIYELGYELNNRPDWVIVPFRGIRNLLEVI